MIKVRCPVCDRKLEPAIAQRHETGQEWTLEIPLAGPVLRQPVRGA